MRIAHSTCACAYEDPIPRSVLPCMHMRIAHARSTQHMQMHVMHMHAMHMHSMPMLLVQIMPLDVFRDAIKTGNLPILTSMQISGVCSISNVFWHWAEGRCAIIRLVFWNRNTTPSW